MSLEKLKIDKSPACFNPLAGKHNALVQLLALMKGEKGIKVDVTEKNIVITVDKNGVSKTKELHYADDFSTIDIDGDGINMAKVGAATAVSFSFSVTDGIIRLESGNNYINLAPGGDGFQMGAGSGEMAFAGSDWGAHNIGIQNISVCNNGNANYMLILGSQPF